jgi:hypothetical protein
MRFTGCFPSGWAGHSFPKTPAAIFDERPGSIQCFNQPDFTQHFRRSLTGPGAPLLWTALLESSAFHATAPNFKTQYVVFRFMVFFYSIKVLMLVSNRDLPARQHVAVLTHL